MPSLTQWRWVWIDSGSWWWTETPGMLRSMGSQRVGHDWETELNWTEPACLSPTSQLHLCYLTLMQTLSGANASAEVYVAIPPLQLPNSRAGPSHSSHHSSAQMKLLTRLPEGLEEKERERLRERHMPSLLPLLPCQNHTHTHTINLKNCYWIMC